MNVRENATAKLYEQHDRVSFTSNDGKTTITGRVVSSIGHLIYNSLVTVELDIVPESKSMNQIIMREEDLTRLYAVVGEGVTITEDGFYSNWTIKAIMKNVMMLTRDHDSAEGKAGETILAQSVGGGAKRWKLEDGQFIKYGVRLAIYETTVAASSPKETIAEVVEPEIVAAVAETDVAPEIVAEPEMVAEETPEVPETDEAPRKSRKQK